MRWPIAIALTAALLGSARADDAPAESGVRGQTAYLKGEERYAAGAYEDAARLFDQAYRASGQSQVLLRLADAHERSGAWADAADALSRYAEVEPSAAVESRLARLVERATAEHQATVAPLAGPEPAPERDHDAGVGWAPTLLWTGAGVAALAATTAYVLRADAAAEVEKGCGEHEGRVLCTDQGRRAVSRERRWAVVGDASAIAGGIALVVGTVVYLRSDDGERELSVGASGDGANVSLRWRF